MLPAGLLPHLDDLTVEDLVARDEEIVLVVSARAQTADCPDCTAHSDRVHSRYSRTLRDLPIGSKSVTLSVRVRRFRCPNRHCRRKTFAERFSELGQVRARRTSGQAAALEEVGVALGGAAGARLARQVRLLASGSTILRLIHSAEEPSPPTPRILGVDDWARLRGRTYGTILVDLERHQPVALLEDRSAKTLAQWLTEHPGVEIITRDRAGAYADGAHQGAPMAVQIADRFHLLMNVGDALERVLTRKHSLLKATATAIELLVAESEKANAIADTPDLVADAPVPVPMLVPAPVSTAANASTQQEQLKEVRRARRLERYEAVVALHKQGMSMRAIGRELGIGKNTVNRYIRAEQFPERAERKSRVTIISPYEGYLRERWTAGCHNARTLWEEIKGQGFPGSAPLVRQFLAHWRPGPGRRGKTPRRAATEPDVSTPPVRQPIRVLSPRQARWLLLKNVADLRPEEWLYREKLLEADADLVSAKGLAEEFGRIVRERDCPALGSWLEKSENSGVGEFRQFVLVLRRDLAAVEAGLTYEWSNGQTEGQINRLKALKRQMFGRASLPLLRRRFLPAA